ncbi:hypothetical protein [Streptomyces sp. NPDC059753]|uniref:hypothetical protein n=1 Tax=Streptomyces sp. NPDC059753 TaxID=3346933 RepID=UPI00366898F4
MSARDDIAAHFTSGALADELLDAYREEVLETAAHWLEAVGEMTAPYLIRTCDGPRRGEKATAAAATATPTPFLEDARLRTLHDAMRTQPGQWRTSHARRALRDAGFKGLGRNTASQFLRALVEKGLATAHGPEDGRFYTLSTTGKDGRA